MEPVQSPRRAIAMLMVLLLATAALFGVVTAAEATQITYWKSIQPSGNAGANAPISISGSTSYRDSPLMPATAKMFVDGIAIPRSSFTASISNSSAYFYYLPQPKLSDGPHTFRVEVSDGQGRLSYRQWTANIVEPPTAAWVKPLAGSTDRTGRPEIVMTLADNTPETTFTVAGQVRSGTAAGPVVMAFGGSGLPAGQNAFALPAELSPGVYYLTATVTDAAGNSQSLLGPAARGFAMATTTAMSVLSDCSDCHEDHRSAHPTTAECMACHPGYDGDHMEGTGYCEDCHWEGWHDGGAGQQVAVVSECTACHSIERPDVAQHTAASVAGSHASSCGGCHVTSLVTQHTYTPSGSSYATQCDLCHASTDPAVVAAIVAGEASCDRCHDGQHGGMDAAHVRQPSTIACGLGTGCHGGDLAAVHTDATTTVSGQTVSSCLVCHSQGDPASSECSGCHEADPHGDITAAHTFSTMGTDCDGSGCHVNTLPEVHESLVGTGKRYPQYATTCDLCHDNEDPERIDWASASADCDTCHVERHGDVALKHTSPTSSTCFGAGCHGASKDLPTVHALYAGPGTEYGYATTCELCHDNRDPERIDWDTATAQCTGGCHSGTTHSEYNAKHTVTTASSACTGCHGTNLSGIHGATDVTKCATCHGSTGNWAESAECASCHEATEDPHRPVHETRNFQGEVKLFDDHDGMGYLGWWLDCAMCHKPNLLDLHGNQCATCHEGSNPRDTFTTWNGGCQQGGCHTTMHDQVDAGHSYEENNNCDSCHENDWSVWVETCGNCHTVVDNRPPTTTSNTLASYLGRATITLNAVDEFPSTAPVRTFYKLDDGATAEGNSVVVPGPAAGAQTHTLRFWSSDGADHVEATKTVSFTISADTVAPVTVSDAKQSYVGVARIRLTATDNATQNGVKQTYYRLDGGAVATGTLVTVQQPATTTEHTLEFWSVDTSDNEEAHHTVTFTSSVDTAPPVTTLTGLSPWLRVQQPALDLLATDVGDSGVVASYARLDGVTNYGGPSTGSLRFYPMLTQGTHTFTYWSMDAAGLVESVNTTTFGVDWTRPVTTTNAKPSYYGTATITLTPSDATSGLKNTYYSINSAPTQTGTTITLPAPASGSSYYIVRYWSEDVAGNVEQNRYSYIWVYPPAGDTIPPSGLMYVNAGSNYTSSTAATVDSNVSDSGSGMYQMCVDPGSGTYGPWVPYTATYAITLPGADGGKTVRVQYKDNAGNITTLSDSLTLDRVAPSGTMSIANGATQVNYANVNVTSYVSDGTSGMGTMRVDPGTGVWSAWVLYTFNYPINLTSGNGTKTVTAQYRDAAGNTLTLTDTIWRGSDGWPPTTTSNAVASYVGTATIALTATDVSLGSGVASTYYRLDGGPQTGGSSIVVAPPASGTVTHTIEFWSVDVVGNVENPHKTATFSVAASAPLGGTESFTFTGGDQSFTVPADVTALTVDLYGGQGGGIESWTGGLGGRVHAVIPVTPGQVLTVKVGGAAGMSSTVGGWPNGGNGGGYCGSSGGGSTSILAGTSVLAEAGGGGGADHEGYDGGDGGAQGWLPGGNQRGGDDDGAGGGGGWNGGAGYFEHEGGGDGGTSYIAIGSGTLTSGVRTGNGAAAFTWTVGQPDNAAPTTTSNAQASYTGSAAIALSAGDTGGSGVKATYYRLDGGAQQTGTSVNVSTVGDHSLEFWSEDHAGNVETPHKTVAFTISPPPPVQYGTIHFAWDSPPDGSWAEVWVRDSAGNVVFNESSDEWDDGWFTATVPVSSEPYQLTAHWYDSYTDVEDESYSTALIDSAGKVVTWGY